jgi:hypothetical protein
MSGTVLKAAEELAAMLDGSVKPVNAEGVCLSILKPRPGNSRKISWI